MSSLPSNGLTMELSPIPSGGSGAITASSTRQNVRVSRVVAVADPPREREVPGLVAGGLADSAIARRLGPAPNTAGNHISSIFAKLRVAGRAEAIVRARSARLGE